MCLLFSVLDAQKIDSKKLQKLANDVAKTMAQSERDGFGVSILNDDSSVFFKKFLQGYEKEAPLFKRLSGTFASGEIRSPISIIFHGRTSTNKIGLRQTHPMISGDIILSHNGVVYDESGKLDSKTGNDSELISDAIYRFGHVAATNYLSGYYAAMYFKQGTDNLYVLRDDTAPLNIAFCESLDSDVIYSRESQRLDLEKLGYTFSNVSEYSENIYAVYRAGELLHYEDIEPRGYDYRSAEYARASLGALLDETDFNISQDDKELSHVEAIANGLALDDTASIYCPWEGIISWNRFMQLSEEDQLCCELYGFSGLMVKAAI